MLLNEINNDLKQAMRGREEFRLLVLRMFLAAIKNKKIEMGNKEELTDDGVVAVLKSEIKKRKDSMAIYNEGDRDDLAKKEGEEIKILEKYMPEMMGEDEVEKIVREVIASLGEVGPGDFGRVMGAVMGRVKGKADGGIVSQAVKKVLTD